MMQFYLWDNFTNTFIMNIGRPYHDGVVGEIVPDFLDVLDEVLRVSVGHVDADELDVRNLLHNATEQLEVRVADPDHKWIQIWFFDSKCYST